MPTPPTPQRWPSDRALLLCHGVGNYGPGDYDDVKAALRAAVGAAEWAKIAVYEVFYDEIDDWFVTKSGAQDLIARAIAFFKGAAGGTSTAEAAAEGACDVIWPALSLAARDALRRRFIEFYQQMVIDGSDSGHPPRDQQVVVMGHSLGCFHSYEALWAIANDPQHRVRPAMGEGPRLRSVVWVASPVKLIRSVAEHLGDLVPDRATLATTSNRGLEVPVQRTWRGDFPLTDHAVSLTGTMDPVGGHLLGRRLDWAYMELAGDGYEGRVQPQQIVNAPAGRDAASLFRELVDRDKPVLGVDNPHSWKRYVETNAALMRQWVLA